MQLCLDVPRVKEEEQEEEEKQEEVELRACVRSLWLALVQPVLRGNLRQDAE